MFSGSNKREDRLAAFLEQHGCAVEEVDIINDPIKQDLANDAVWLPFLARIKAGEFEAIFASPPCRTHSTARRIRPGPPVLRSPEHVLGFPRKMALQRGITEADLEELRLDNLLASRTVEALFAQYTARGAGGVEQPAKLDEQHAVMYDREDFEALFETGFKATALDQCRYGAATAKPTDLRASWIDFSELACKCNHDKDWHWWGKVGGGKWIHTAHPYTAGCKDPNGKDWATKQQSAYPRALNEALAKAISKAAWTIRRMRRGAAAFDKPAAPSAPASSSGHHQFHTQAPAAPPHTEDHTTQQAE